MCPGCCLKLRFFQELRQLPACPGAAMPERCCLGARPKAEPVRRNDNQFPFRRETPPKLGEHSPRRMGFLQPVQHDDPREHTVAKRQPVLLKQHRTCTLGCGRPAKPPCAAGMAATRTSARAPSLSSSGVAKPTPNTCSRARSLPHSAPTRWASVSAAALPSGVV